MLSATSSTRAGRSAAASWSSAVAADCDVRPSARSSVTATRSGSLTGARSANAVPSGNRPASSAAACSATRVLPVPPVPVSVTSRHPGTTAVTAATSAARPTSGVSGTGSGAGARRPPPGFAAGPGSGAAAARARPARRAAGAGSRGRAPSGPEVHAWAGMARSGTAISASSPRASAAEPTVPQSARAVTIAATSAAFSSAPR